MGTLSTLVSLAFSFGVGRDFLTFLDSGSEAEPSLDRPAWRPSFVVWWVLYLSWFRSRDSLLLLGGKGVGPPFFPLEAGRSGMGETEGFGGGWAGQMATSGTSARTGRKAYVPIGS